MRSLAAKRLIKFELLLGASAGVLGIAAYQDRSPLLIESLESKTVELKPVYNRISYQPGANQDKWVMQQSHFGLNHSPHEWDRIAIVVNKTTYPFRATFYQVASGDLDSPIQPRTKKISCGLCHANGPRAIRPNFDSPLVKLSPWNRARVALWNLRIKSYGRVISHAEGDGPPFKMSGSMANLPLNSKTCNLCHRDSGLFARGRLTRQNFMSIRFMVESGQMPPFGIPLSNKERAQIITFAGG